MNGLETLDLRGKSSKPTSYSDYLLVERSFRKKTRIIINSNSFTDLIKLKYLDLSQNSIDSLPHNAFHSLNTLNALNMSDNKLASLPHTVFHGLSSLTVLDLSQNQLTNFPSDAFKDLTKLTHLYLQDNKLKNMPHTFFLDLSFFSLRYLNLSYNQFDLKQYFTVAETKTKQRTNETKNVYMTQSGILIYLNNNNKLKTFPLIYV